VGIYSTLKSFVPAGAKVFILQPFPLPAPWSQQPCCLYYIAFIWLLPAKAGLNRERILIGGAADWPIAARLEFSLLLVGIVFLSGCYLITKSRRFAETLYSGIFRETAAIWSYGHWTIPAHLVGVSAHSLWAGLLKRLPRVRPLCYGF